MPLYDRYTIEELMKFHEIAASEDMFLSIRKELFTEEQMFYLTNIKGYIPMGVENSWSVLEEKNWLHIILDWVDDKSFNTDPYEETFHQQLRKWLDETV